MTDQEPFGQLLLADRDQLRLILEHGIRRLIELEASARINYASGSKSRLTARHQFVHA
jgi:hypothetical protein